jgi:hypothetical protein
MFNKKQFGLEGIVAMIHLADVSILVFSIFIPPLPYGITRAVTLRRHQP